MSQYFFCGRREGGASMFEYVGTSNGTSIAFSSASICFRFLYFLGAEYRGFLNGRFAVTRFSTGVIGPAAEEAAGEESVEVGVTSRESVISTVLRDVTLVREEDDLVRAGARLESFLGPLQKDC